MPCLAARFSATLTPSLGIKVRNAFRDFRANEKPNMLDVRAVVFSSCAPTQIIAVSANNSFAELKRSFLFQVS